MEEKLCLAELEIGANQLKEGRNTCWRVIKLCKTNGGYGPFYSENRAPYYIRAYVLLAEIYSGEPFYDDRYNISNYEKALTYFQQCDSAEELKQKQPYVDKCMMQLVESYENSGRIDEAIALCWELSDRYSCRNMQEASDETIVTASALYRLGGCIKERMRWKMRSTFMSKLPSLAAKEDSILKMISILHGCI